MVDLLYKDEVLDYMSRTRNVAQFISYAPNLSQRYSRVIGFTDNYTFKSVTQGVFSLLESSPEHSINVRSFLPNDPKSHDFVYGIQDVASAVDIVLKLSRIGLYTIVNETIDVNDGGVSGVIENGMMEFAPGVVPRFVETSTDPIATMRLDIGVEMLETVYGIKLPLGDTTNKRLEFSVHPNPRGYSNSNLIVWEEQDSPDEKVEACYIWPNAFSKLIGDKAYGLLLARIFRFNVPTTTVYCRNKVIHPFTFGEASFDTFLDGSSKVWTRTCPKTQEPGKFTTVNYYTDPYQLMDLDDPSGGILASCLVQEAVDASYSGTLVSSDNDVIIDGVKGVGDDYMIGVKPPEVLPERITDNIITMYELLKNVFGYVRFEWVHDGITPWLVQLHQGETPSSCKVIYPGEFENSVIFNVSQGLPYLRSIISSLSVNSGIIVEGNMGMGSHIADVLRKAKVPSVRI